MKKFSLYNLFFIIVWISLFGYLVFRTTKYISNKNSIERNIAKLQEECQNINSQNQDKCEIILSMSSEYGDFYLAFYNIFCTEVNPIIIISIIVILSVYPITKYFKHNMLANDLVRLSYNNIKKRLFKKAYLPVLILPLLCVITFIISYLIYGSFKYTPLYNDALIWQVTLKNKPLLFILLYIINFANNCSKKS